MKKNNPLRKKIVRLLRPISSFIYYLFTFDYKISIRVNPVINGKSYPYISTTASKFLMSLDLNKKNILEFGSGHSTIFFCERKARVYALERQEKWKLKILSHPSTTSKNLIFINENQLKEISRLKFDIIFIDDNYREKRLKYAFNNLKDGGLIIFDNSERYSELMNRANRSGYLIINFWGNCADTHKHICTSIMIKNKNFKQSFLDFNKFIF